MSLEDLIAALSDYLLESGFQNESMYFQQMDEHSLDALREAIQQALERGDFLSDELREKIEQMQMEGTLDELVHQLIERMQQEDFISIDQPYDRTRQSTAPGQVGDSQAQVRFEITDKGLDFLGYPIRASTFWGIRRCATCSALWGAPASDVMTRAIWPPASRAAGPRSPTSSATR